ncbi:membrane protein BRI3 isoform X2 [Ahaetulla prasina]|uniref:membrane protein BRI3 isoform X2 n=1 Tax=Ahaetulla prasina TaxID=499056 RepID=UPI0026497AA6|nr:membrane protein BRI3 isoform X2 [Ahaetulla prasina]
MDTKPLLQDRPPPYSPYGPAGNYAAAQTYGAILPAPPYPFPAGAGPGYTAPASSQPHNYPNTTYTIIQQPPPTTSVIVVGGCPACSSAHAHTRNRLLLLFCLADVGLRRQQRTT